jgi:hypothetical protein
MINNIPRNFRLGLRGLVEKVLAQGMKFGGHTVVREGASIVAVADAKYTTARFLLGSSALSKASGT